VVHAPQVHLSVGGAGEVLVMWATGKAQARAPALCHLAAACNYAKAPTWALQRMRMHAARAPCQYLPGACQCVCSLSTRCVLDTVSNTRQRCMMRVWSESACACRELLCIRCSARDDTDLP